MKLILLCIIAVCLGCAATVQPIAQPAAPVVVLPAPIQTLSNGCEIDCDGVTATVTCPVHQGCPNHDGPAFATVFDYAGKPSFAAEAATKHMLKSKSPCGCVTKCEICDCVPNGAYPGTCKNMICTYRLPCKPKPKP